MPDALESMVSPPNLPEDDDNNILGLREKLISVVIDDRSQTAWDWPAIQSALVGIGYKPSAKSGPLTALGEHFFHCALEASGHPRQSSGSSLRGRTACIRHYRVSMGRRPIWSIPL